MLIIEQSIRQWTITALMFHKSLMTYHCFNVLMTGFFLMLHCQNIISIFKTYTVMTMQLFKNLYDHAPRSTVLVLPNVNYIFLYIYMIVHLYYSSMYHLEPYACH